MTTDVATALTNQLMAKVVKKHKVLTRKLPQNGRICFNMMRQHFASSPLLRANLNTSVDIEKDPYNDKIWKIYRCRRSIHCHDGTAEGKAKHGQLAFSSTCKKRVCNGCAKCRGVLQRYAYVPSIVGLQQEAEKSRKGPLKHQEAGFYFVTLTQPTVFFDQLRGQIDTISKEWRKLYELTKKKGNPYYLSGLRTFEFEMREIVPKMLEDRVGGYRKALKSRRVESSKSLTQLLHDKIAKIEEVQSYVFKLKNRLTRIAKKGNIFDFNKCDQALRKFWQDNVYKLYTYHPHMHLLVQGRDNALWVKRQWLKRFPDALDKSQKVMKVGESIEDDNLEVRHGKISKMLYEVTKYVTKTIGPQREGKKEAYCRAIYWLQNDHLHRRNTFAAFGRVKKASPKESAAFFEEQKLAGYYDVIDNDEDLTTEELEKMVKREAYQVDEDRKELPGHTMHWNEEKKNYTKEIIDKGTGEVTEIRLATNKDWNQERDLTPHGKKLYCTKLYMEDPTEAFSDIQKHKKRGQE